MNVYDREAWQAFTARYRRPDGAPTGVRAWIGSDVTCPDCGASFSSYIYKCPDCGQERRWMRSKLAWMRHVGFAFLFAGIVPVACLALALLTIPPLLVLAIAGVEAGTGWPWERGATFLGLLIALLVFEIAIVYAWNRLHSRAAPAITAPIDQIVTGALCAVAVVGIAFLLFGNPWDELRLIRTGETATGYMLDYEQDVVERNDGRTVDVVYRVTYGYRVDGRAYEATFNRPAPLQTAKIEYVPGDPSVSRAEGVGHSSFRSWLIANVIAGAIVAALVGACLGMVLRGCRQLWATRGLPKQPSLL